MNTENNATSVADAASESNASRLRRLAETLGAEIERMRTDVRIALQERDEAEERLRALHIRNTETQISAWQAERERQTAQRDLARARAHIVRVQPLLRQAQTLLISMQASKFWQARNLWFSMKHRARLHPHGPQQFWSPEIDDLSDVWERDASYDRWLLEHRVRPGDVQRMRDLLPLLARRPTFSVLMPVYDAPERFLREAIESVQLQAYPDWELCIADDASPSAHVRRVLEECAADDPRIKLVFRTTNGHISANSNSALGLATGDFIALLDHDDLLAVDALFESALVINRFDDVDIIYSDEDKVDENGRRRDPYFKPDWSPDSILSRNYVSHLGIYRRSLVEEVGGFRTGFEGSQDYDLLLRASERARRVEHIPRVLYHWRIHEDSTASSRGQKTYAYDAAVQALTDALQRRGEPGEVAMADGRLPGTYVVRYHVRSPDRVSLIIPTRDHGSDVDRCLRSVFEQSTYPNIEVVLLDNGSTDAESLRVFGTWAQREPKRLTLLPYDVPFNFSRINNYAVAHATGAYVLLLNNDTEVITPDWIEAMVEQAQRPAIGAVGAKLLYDDGTVQHAGVIVGLGGVAGHSHKYAQRDEPGYFGTLQTTTNFSAVTGACLMVRRTVYDEVGGLNEDLAIAFNDVDFCLRVQEAGYRNVYLPHVELYHHESKSRGAENTPEKMERFLREQRYMRERWSTDCKPDPHYNRNLTLQTENFAIGP